MKYLYGMILSLLICVPVYAEGTQTFSQVKSLDITKSYLDISKIVISEETEAVTITQDKKVLCFTINNQYKITDNKELILLLLEIITDMKAK